MKTFFFALRINFGGIRNIGKREDLFLFFAFLVQAPHQYNYIRDPLFFGLRPYIDPLYIKGEENYQACGLRQRRDFTSRAIELTITTHYFDFCGFALVSNL